MQEAADDMIASAIHSADIIFYVVGARNVYEKISMK